MVMKSFSFMRIASVSGNNCHKSRYYTLKRGYGFDSAA